MVVITEKITLALCGALYVMTSRLYQRATKVMWVTMSNLHFI